MMKHREKLDQLLAKVESGDINTSWLADGTGVILDIDKHQVLTLNDTGVVLFKALQNHVYSVKELGDVLVSEFNVDHVTAEVDAEQFIQSILSHFS